MVFFEFVSTTAVTEELLDVEVDVDAGIDGEEGRVGVGKKELIGLVGFKL